MAPNIEALKACIGNLASAMSMKPLSDERCVKLIYHVLYTEEYGGVEGKNSWSCLQNKIITEREVRTLLMSHSATKIATANLLPEPGCNTYGSCEFDNSFEFALYGRLAALV